MCDECGCGPRIHRYEGRHGPFTGFLPLMSVEEEIKMLEELKAALEDRLNKVNRRLEVLKH